MKYFIFTVLLAIVQAAPPVPRKTPDNASASRQSVQKDATANQSPTAPLSTSKDTIKSEPQQRQAGEPNNSHEQITIVVQQPASSWEKAYVIITALLAIIGMFGVAAAFRTLRVVEAQARIMQGQLTAMQGQLGQMESTGKQTEQLIEQAKAQVKQSKDSTDIALTNAENALLHTKVLIHAERPWVLIQESVYLPPGNSAIRRAQIYFRAKNWGRNPARVTRYSCNWEFWVWNSNLPDEPTYQQTELKYPKYLVPNADMEVFAYDCASAMNDGIWDSMNKENQRILFTGHIVYLDLATGEDHETRFCYSYTPHGTLILQGPRSYNSHA